MDSIEGLGNAAWPDNGPSTQSGTSGSTGWSAALAEALASAGSSNSAVDGTKPSAVRTSLLVALQDVRMTTAADVARQEEKAKHSGEPVDAPRLFTKASEADGEKTDLERTLEEIKEKGLAAWAHEQWLERIREKARQSALNQLGLTEDDLNHMSPEMRAQVERIIKEIVDEAVRQATEKAPQEEDKKPTGQAKVVNPIITGG